MLQKLIALLFVAVIALGAWYVLRAPVPIEPVAWTPPNPPGATGRYARNSLLSGIERLGDGMGEGPEAVAVDGAGRIYTGLADGSVIRISSDGSDLERVTTTGGRPLGLAIDAAGDLIVADAYQGLLRIDSEGGVTPLAREHGGIPFRLTNDLDIARDGTIYFTDSSYRFPLSMYTADLMEHRPNGRLLAYDPSSEETRLISDGLYFPNGVAISADQNSVLVAETAKYRIRRVWIQGDRTGESEVVIDNLPGFPDNVTRNPRGYWVALVAPRDPNVDQRLLPSPFMRRLVMRLPEAYHPEPGVFSYVVELDPEGSVIRTLQDPAAGFSRISSVLEVGGTLYFGSLSETAVGRMDVP